MSNILRKKERNSVYIYIYKLGVNSLILFSYLIGNIVPFITNVLAFNNFI